MPPASGLTRRKRYVAMRSMASPSAAMDANGDKRLSADELQAFLVDAPKGAPSAAERIVVADLDADGALDQNEVYGAAEMRFDSLDRNGDGNLDQAEFAAGFGVRAR